MNAFASQTVTVFVKELRDALRDRRTLSRLLLPNLVIGPLMLFAIVGYMASIAERSGRHEIVVGGIDHAPSLEAFLRGRGFAVKPAGTDYAARLHDHTLQDPVLLVPDDFETSLASGRPAKIELVNDSTNDVATATLGSVEALLRAFNAERAAGNLSRRGLEAAALEPVSVRERDLATDRARMGRLTTIIPMFLAIALFMGAQAGAVDSTAGERERGSLEPLLINPLSGTAIVLGKWGAVVAMSALACLVSSLSFIPAQWLLPGLSEVLHFGWREAFDLWAFQIPLAAAISASLLALAIRSRSFKEAQASAGLVWTGFSLVLAIPLFTGGAEAPWHRWVPGLAQSNQMNLVLRGESPDAAQVLVSTLACVVLTLVALAYVARSMRAAVAR